MFVCDVLRWLKMRIEQRTPSQILPFSTENSGKTKVEWRAWIFRCLSLVFFAALCFSPPPHLQMPFSRFATGLGVGKTPSAHSWIMIGVVILGFLLQLIFPWEEAAILPTMGRFPNLMRLLGPFVSTGSSCMFWRLYYSKIGLGSPVKDYHVQVDTGSDILWVNCADCFTCPTKSDIGIELSLYDPQKSESGSTVTCDNKFCVETYSGPLPGCKPELNCRYKVVYGDGSSSSGYFVEDVLQFHQTSGDFQTKLSNGTVVFGCGNKQDGGLGTSSEALDGIIGFGQANSSMISQLASSGRVKKTFSHCLDNVNGGGIFAIGEVVQPKLNMTSLVPNQPHYNVVMKSIDVGGNVITLHKGILGFGNQQMTIIDSGTTLAYFPSDVYDLLVSKIFSSHPDLKLETVQRLYKCFTYAGNIEDDFPPVTLNFEGSLYLTVTPLEYLFQIMSNTWCIGWQSGSMQSNDGKEVIILGDLILSNKLVIYDLENQTIGWTGYYNCSSSIKVKDDESGVVHLVGAHDISCVERSVTAWMKTMLLMCVLLCFNL